MSIPEGLQYEKSFEVGSYQVHPHGNIRLTSLADLFQEIAWLHADSAQFGRNLQESNQMWVLSRLDIHIYTFPKWGDRLTFFTGGRGADKLFAFREFLVWNEHQEVVARAMSSWLLVDMNTKRILRAESVLPSALFDPTQKPQWQPSKIQIQGKLLTQEEIQVRISDLDLNHHVNNTSYVRWVENALGEMGYFPESINLNYISECKGGDMVSLEIFQGENGLWVEGKVSTKTVFLAECKTPS